MVTGDPVVDESKMINAGKYKPYTIIDKLGAGGMGEVLRVKDKRGKERALKFIKMDVSDERGISVLARFQREIKAMNELQHPNIIRIVDMGIGKIMGESQAFYVMELVDGNDLKQEIEKNRRKPLPIDEAKRFACQIIDGVCAAHQRGILHRDLKPANIFISKKGSEPVVKVADFGLAKFTEGEDEADNITKTMQVMGTPKYMAPELLGGMKEGSDRSDQYAIGIIMYEMLTGRAPYGNEPENRGFLECLAQHRRGEYPPIRSMNRDVSRELELIVAKAMSVKPKERFADLAEMKAAIIAEGANEPVIERIPESILLDEEPIDLGRSKGNLGRYLAGIGALLAAGGIGMAYYGNKIPDVSQYIEQINLESGMTGRKENEALISTDPKGANVYNSRGEKIGSTDKPLKVELKDGQNIFTIRKEGFNTKRISLRIGQGDITVSLKK